MDAGCCLICNRPLGRDDDPLSLDCGGDCWGCVGAMEYDAGIGELERSRIEREIEVGLRGADGEASGRKKGVSGR